MEDLLASILNEKRCVCEGGRERGRDGRREREKERSWVREGGETPNDLLQILSPLWQLAETQHRFPVSIT